ncbi:MULTISPECIES: hypothetical protein, partial [unclassified Bilifractor]
FQNLLIFRLCFGFLFGIVCVFSFQGTYLALSAIPAGKKSDLQEAFANSKGSTGKSTRGSQNMIFSARITGKAFAFPAASDSLLL